MAASKRRQWGVYPRMWGPFPSQTKLRIVEHVRLGQIRHVSELLVVIQARSNV
jgi:hypothetical protein